MQVCTRQRVPPPLERCCWRSHRNSPFDACFLRPAPQVNTIELRQRSKPIHNIRAAREGVGQAELEFDALKQFMDGASGIIPAIFLPDSGSKPRTPGGTVRPVAPDTKRPGGTPGSTPVRLSRLLKVSLIADC